jgi:hypothetical protein
MMTEGSPIKQRGHIKQTKTKQTTKRNHMDEIKWTKTRSKRLTKPKTVKVKQTKAINNKETQNETSRVAHDG